MKSPAVRPGARFAVRLPPRFAVRLPPRFALMALLVAAAPACRHDNDAVLLVVVTALGTPPSIAALDVKLTGPAGPSTKRYTGEGNDPIAFPTTLSAQLPAFATGTLTIDVDAIEAAGGTTIASGHGGPITIGAGQRQTVFVRLDCGGETCVVDIGSGNSDGGPPPPSPRCGNGRVDPGETCDTAIAAGAPGACPATCDDNVPCTDDMPVGSGCELECQHKPITEAHVGDHCCATEGDPDCLPTCMNGIVDSGETCDTAIPRGMAGACPTAMDCMPNAACATSMLVSAGTCAAVCVHYQIVTAVHDDGCCPPGAAYMVDHDCPRLCGNGVQDQGESCDVGIPPLARGACPTSCDDGDACTTDFMRPIGCQAACQHLPITAPISGDGCCPKDEDGNPLANRLTDTDCQPVCHNGVIEPGESCDDDLATHSNPALPKSCPEHPPDCPPAPMLRENVPGCLRSKVIGDWQTCSARCAIEEMTACSFEVIDGCCPAGCTAATDKDCSRGCGDGAQDEFEHETCDIGVPIFDPDHPDPSQCPLSCADANACTDDLLVSAGTCSAACMSLPTRTVRPGDGCCPDIRGPGGTFQRASFVLDPDCSPVCGNGVIESPAERCDHAIPDSCPTKATCPDQLGCTRYAVQGVGYTCTATCVATPITKRVDGDGCCPPGATSANDSDCPALCGNGIVEDRENCDRAITPGTPGACLRSCDDGIACTLDFASGSAEACSRTCTHQPITGCIDDDGCCPQGCSAVNDHDCDPRCGDGKVGAGETCDPPGTCPTACPDDGDACTIDRLVGDPATCSSACRHDPLTACSGDTRDSCCPTGCTPTNDRDC
jgi:hypothetical protein